jgi:acyl-CoA reductase-like NAD-dependent aldehyde dehydrogenase
MYVPRSLWDEIRERLVAGTAEMRMGDTRRLLELLGAVIDQRAFKTQGYSTLGAKRRRDDLRRRRRRPRGLVREPTVVARRRLRPPPHAGRDLRPDR